MIVSQGLASLIRIEFDNTSVAENDARTLALAVRDIVPEDTSIKDVFVYANSAFIKIQVAPVEIFIEISARKIEDLEALMAHKEPLS